MSKRERKFDLVINFLEEERIRLQDEIKSNQGSGKIELKCQVEDAINSLEICTKHNLFKENIEIVNIQEGGSESYFTEFYVVDECEIDRIHEDSIKKDDNGNNLKLNCFDLLIKKKGTYL